MSKRGKRLVSVLVTLVMMISAVNLQAVGAFATSSVTLKGSNVPKSITKGTNLKVKGTIVSNEKINRVEIGIVKASDLNKWTKYKYDNAKVKSKKFKVKKAAKKLKFNKLKTGTYYYRIYAHTDSGVSIVQNKKFKVKKAPVKKTVVASTSSDNVVVDMLNAITGEKVDKVKLSSYNCPTKLSSKANYSVKGKITCSSTINRVEIGIVVTATNKWTAYKYDNRYVNATSFDISNAAPALAFNRLPGGNFTYRIYVHTDNGTALLLDRPFEVAANSGPRKAIKWATDLAADDHFTYGKGYGRHSQCCICAGKTKKKSHAQFTCMPFLAAAYAHGTGKLDSLDKGQAGYHFMHLNDKNFKGELGESWFKIGLCRDLSIEDLQPGDVIIKWSDNDSTGHAWMYGGGDKIIEAVPSDIHVLETGAAAKLRRYGTVEGKPKQNYVMRYRG